MQKSKNNIKRDASTAKELNSQLKIIEGKIDAKKSELLNSQRELDVLQKNKEEIRNKLNSFSKNKVTVSEHALLRYIERIKKVNTHELRKEIVNDKILNMISQLGGNGTYPHEDGFKLVIKNNVVVTIKT